jgi:hypothetical protein
MNPGLPGLGIGGLYYILSALAMPAAAVLRRLRRQPGSAVRWSLAARQCAIAIGIVLAMAVAFWALDAALGSTIRASVWSTAEQALAAASLRVSALTISLAVLAAVLLAMHAVRLAVRARRGALPALPGR